MKPINQLKMTYQDLLITTTEAENYAQKYFGITAKAKALPGFEDFNFRLKVDNGEMYILKISRADVDIEVLDFQTQTLNHLATRKLSVELPKPVRNLNGETYFSFQDENGLTRWMKMNTWVNGRMAFEAKYHPAEMLESWGRVCGELYENLKGFEHKAAYKGHDWDLSISLNNRVLRQYIEDEKHLKIADYFWNLFEKEALPIYPSLPKGIIHSDVNDYNLLVNNDLDNVQITGVIDYGDALFTHRINELAIACAYATMFKANPLEAAANLVKGYHKVTPLLAEELQILLPLITGRLLTSAIYAAKNHVFEPDNEYLFISEKPAWDALELWYKIPPKLVYYTFRNACGLEPCLKRVFFDDFISSDKNSFANVIQVNDKKIISLDLSVSSLDLGNNINFENPRNFQKRIDDILWENEAEIGIGGYGEIRPFYNTDAYILPSNNGRQWRTVHLGLDIWTKVRTPVFAAFDGKVYSIKDNKGDDNYGPTIILEHEVNADLTFYTLYGHLSPIADDLKVGQAIKKGEEIATIGTFPQNGNWAEHLHFQVILDMLGQNGDFFGVCTPNDKAVWLSICPNPCVPGASAAIFDDNAATEAAATGNEIFDKRQNYLGKNLSLSYKKPLHIVRAYKQYLYDENGRRYLDTVNNVPHIGHQHPKVVRAAKRQMEVLNTNTRYLHENVVNYAEALLATFPPELCVCYFVNSGSEANELALRMAKIVSNQEDMIALEVGYHGNTNETIAISSYKFDSKGGNGKPKKTHIVPMPDTYRGEYKAVETAGKLYAKSIQTAIENIQNQGRNIAGFICESILSCGGQIVLPPNYLKTAYEFVRESGGVCIADEVQVGFGRVGATFWGFELQDVVPDIVTMGKPIGNGHPLAAVVTTRKIAEAFDNGMEYFNTFGGNPVSCAIGQAVLEVIQTEELQENALNIGNYLKSKLEILKDKFLIIGDVRGHGLFLGIELVKDRKTLEPAEYEAAYIANRMKENAILMSTDGVFHNVLKIKPPMCFSRKDADFLVGTLENILSESENININSKNQ
ncbi:MAG: 4-aminobutyrate aminotransferase-like enzyme/Ser/Thr protein kinase RdoA (MazF antagonist) [Saprospiraceae bacterium]|jgi:4-aminobutyrate aminotransferase-like enzyme/Ser/Thr protein kinase RdoA (MazF antagonist)